jgi:hypothetical protein
VERPPGPAPHHGLTREIHAPAAGLVFAIAGTAGYLAGLTVFGIAATSLALVAAFLNGAFGLCLGCEMYLRIRRIRPDRQALPDPR